MRPDTMSGTDTRTDHTKVRAILFANALSLRIHCVQLSKSLYTICVRRLGERESKCTKQLKIS